MSTFNRDQERNRFLDGRIAQLTGDYLTRVERYEEAREEYEEALQCYEQISQSSSDFNQTQNHLKLIKQTFEQPPKRQKSCEDFTIEKLFPAETQTAVKLSQWFDQIFTFNWNEPINNDNNFAGAYRSINEILPTDKGSSRSREKIFDLSGHEDFLNFVSKQVSDQEVENTAPKVALEVTITDTLRNHKLYDILIKLTPVESQTLPLGLTLKVENEEGQPIGQILTATESHTEIKQKFSGGKKNEFFSVNLTLGELSITEDFEI